MSLAKKKKKKKTTGFFVEPPQGLFPSGEEILRLFVVIGLASCVALSCHLLFSFGHRPKVPFCDNGEETLDFCEPCPDHAECSSHSWKCLLGYKKKDKICVEDEEITKQFETFCKMIEEHICVQYAGFLCQHSGKAWFLESDVLKFLENRIKPAGLVDNSDWRFLSQNTMKAVENSLETRISEIGEKEVKCPDKLMVLYKPYSCIVKDWTHRNTWLLITISFLVFPSVMLACRLHRKRHINHRAEELYELACEILEESALYAKNEGTTGEPWVGCSWLRDHLLLPRERRDNVLWRKVEELIREDSRIEQYPRMIKGEQKVVLEWQVEGYLRSERLVTCANTASSRMKILKEANPQQNSRVVFPALASS